MSRSVHSGLQVCVQRLRFVPPWFRTDIETAFDQLIWKAGWAKICSLHLAAKHVGFGGSIPLVPGAQCCIYFHTIETEGIVSAGHRCSKMYRLRRFSGEQCRRLTCWVWTIVPLQSKPAALPYLPYSPAAQHHCPLAGTHCAYPRRDGQAELTWVAGYILR